MSQDSGRQKRYQFASVYLRTFTLSLYLWRIVLTFALHLLIYFTDGRIEKDTSLVDYSKNNLSLFIFVIGVVIMLVAHGTVYYLLLKTSLGSLLQQASFKKKVIAEASLSTLAMIPPSFLFWLGGYMSVLPISLFWFLPLYLSFAIFYSFVKKV